ncbi:hypothetical protein [Variovorax sp. Sphag1AA]|uniref:hypothetical protein n=1 Tax=Variovorax sp. Sphag1AA TaxID=2587027 RepID=UPI00161D35B9|nr:hypothetical protein [Variovorax sp. Sphag1AA]MBB3180091.1 hypothetical protein [Variovorax sp. Sphag1AA]
MKTPPITTSLSLALRLGVDHARILRAIDRAALDHRKVGAAGAWSTHATPRTFVDARGRACGCWQFTLEGLFLVGSYLPHTPRKLRWQCDVAKALSQRIDEQGLGEQMDAWLLRHVGPASEP